VDDFHSGMLSVGECLVDDISVIESPATAPVQFINLYGNFESGLTDGGFWASNHSRVEVDPDNAANHVLHIVAHRSAGTYAQPY